MRSRICIAKALGTTKAIGLRLWGQIAAETPKATGLRFIERHTVQLYSGEKQKAALYRLAACQRLAANEIYAAECSSVHPSVMAFDLTESSLYLPFHSKCLEVVSEEAVEILTMQPWFQTGNKHCHHKYKEELDRTQTFHIHTDTLFLVQLVKGFDSVLCTLCS